MDIFERQAQCAQDYRHISNCGAHRAPLFHDRQDFERFLALLYIANDTGGFILRDIRMDAFSVRRMDALVDIVAYCLVPDGYSIVVRERRENGVRRFVHKLATAYVMYYNRKYRHRGTVFAGTCRSTIVRDNSDLRRIIRQIHLDPVWNDGNDQKEKRNRNPKKALDRASRYEYSSMRDYLDEKRPQNVILTVDRKI